MKIASEDEELTEVEFMLVQQFYEQQGIQMQTVKEDFSSTLHYLNEKLSLCSQFGCCYHLL